MRVSYRSIGKRIVLAVERKATFSSPFLSLPVGFSDGGLSQLYITIPI